MTLFTVRLLWERTEELLLLDVLGLPTAKENVLPEENLLPSISERVAQENTHAQNQIKLFISMTKTSQRTLFGHGASK